MLRLRVESVTSVAEAYTTQPNRKAGSTVLYVYLACMAGCIHTSICVPPRMRSNAVGGRLLNSSLAWDGAVMMPLQFLHTNPSQYRKGGGTEKGGGGVSAELE